MSFFNGLKNVFYGFIFKFLSAFKEGIKMFVYSVSESTLSFLNL